MRGGVNFVEVHALFRSIAKKRWPGRRYSINMVPHTIQEMVIPRWYIMSILYSACSFVYLRFKLSVLLSCYRFYYFHASIRRSPHHMIDAILIETHWVIGILTYFLLWKIGDWALSCESRFTDKIRRQVIGACMCIFLWHKLVKLGQRRRVVFSLPINVVDRKVSNGVLSFFVSFKSHHQSISKIG